MGGNLHQNRPPDSEVPSTMTPAEKQKRSQEAFDNAHYQAMLTGKWDFFDGLILGITIESGILDEVDEVEEDDEL